jgi:RimJ/RimL family protein N-acetyltransferase
MEDWRSSIEEIHDHAWLALWQERPIGLVRVKVVGSDRRCGSMETLLWGGGRDGMGAVRVAILVVDWCFKELGLKALVENGGPGTAALEVPALPGASTRGRRLTPEAWTRRRPELVEESYKLSGFGIELRRLREKDLELVRRWRNDPEIRQYMRFRKEITAEEHRRWFESIDNEQNHYSLVLWRGSPIGLSHVKDCDYTRKTGEGGLYLSAREFRDSTFALRVAIVGTDWCFDELGLETITGTVLKDNRRAIRFNQSLGHVFEPEQPGVDALRCRLSREAYARMRPGLVRLIT